ncbi:MAG: HAD-IB family hydrolase [Actinomycetota bacterium]|nr:HAD-IB family hydrolase [Actinomycetota bacterium]
MANSAAFFDLDRTLMSGSSAYYFGKASYREGLVPLKRLLEDAWNGVVFKLFGASDAKSAVLRDRILESVAGHEAETFQRVSSAVVEQLLARIRPEAQGLLDMHEEAGRDVYIISASPVEIVAELARALGLAGGLGTESEIVDGAYTGRLVGPFCYGDGKAEAVRKLVADRGYDLARCYAYADSASDLPILQLVGHPVAVNPDRSLMSVAHRRGWPVVEFNRQAKQAAKVSAAGTLVVAGAGGGYLLGHRRGSRAGQHARRPPSSGRSLSPRRAWSVGPYLRPRWRGV